MKLSSFSLLRLIQLNSNLVFLNLKEKHLFHKVVCMKVKQCLIIILWLNISKGFLITQMWCIILLNCTSDRPYIQPNTNCKIPALPCLTHQIIASQTFATFKRWFSNFISEKCQSLANQCVMLWFCDVTSAGSWIEVVRNVLYAVFRVEAKLIRI